MTLRPALLALLAGAVVLSGCSATDTTATPAAADKTPAGTTPADERSADCGDAATKIKQYVAGADIRKVTVTGQCTTVMIDTDLSDGDTAGGRQICEAAGKVVYTGDINAVSVLSRSGTELSSGIDGARCLP